MAIPDLLDAALDITRVDNFAVVIFFLSMVVIFDKHAFLDVLASLVLSIEPTA